MDWQTKEYIDTQFEDLNEKMDSIIEHLGINQDEEDFEDDLEVELPEEEVIEEPKVEKEVVEEEDSEDII